MEKCEDCGKKAHGKYYYPTLGHKWKTQCRDCAQAFQAFKPLNEWKSGGVLEAVLQPEQVAEFNTVSEPFMRFLEKHCHPHMKAVVDSSKAELFEAVFCVKNNREDK